MDFSRHLKIGTAIVVIVGILGGCATTGEDATGRTAGAIIGALGGGIIGAKKGGTKGAVAGALIGGAAGYVVGWMVDEYRARKVKTAAQIREQYGTSGEKGPQAGPVVRTYSVVINPDELVQRGGKAEAVTTFDLDAPERTVPRVEEERSLSTPDGAELMRKRYVYKEVDGAGGYEFRTVMPVPEQAEQGRYTYASTLFVNGKEAQKAKNVFQVAGTGRRIAVARTEVTGMDPGMVLP